ncbi:hypothetical protein DAEQUDRAFT_769052 [Daedalea quercina L-15889]|uniref:RING-type domain-containing protein n=1 Tax=Daedalea quercina L-15889 TaxID=1314783 RepID=A0A165M3Y0_9APHY|nr:hypothetical protein DAEQUDRAFT_769052 [Daedalea quercina L-15889]
MRSLAAVYYHPCFFQILFVSFLSRLHLLWFFALALYPALRSTSKWKYAPSRAYSTLLTGILLPELYDLTIASGLGVIHLITFFTVEISWKRDRLAHDNRRHAFGLAKVWWSIEGCFWYHVPVGLMIIFTVAQVGLDAMNWTEVTAFLLFLAVVLHVMIWPLMTMAMVNRDARTSSPRTYTYPFTSENMADALPGARRRKVPADGECAICSSPFRETRCPIIEIPRCGHLFCKACMSDWIRTDHYSCPMCRYNFRYDLIAIINRPFKAKAFYRAIQIAALIWDEAVAVLGVLFLDSRAARVHDELNSRTDLNNGGWSHDTAANIDMPGAYIERRAMATFQPSARGDALAWPEQDSAMQNAARVVAPHEGRNFVEDFLALCAGYDVDPGEAITMVLARMTLTLREGPGSQHDRPQLRPLADVWSSDPRAGR